ncbi:thrombospondin type-1 domain-containing protein 4 isoform X2 [Drosophila pseudoobscura]|uniref:Thrombospondin type-1 domain-containing protein 4 isoform X2 n=1 Tax=Drosophila pseudoobscura pseudoobscura TaxID=46245 RepID=A0A6I8VZC2_DROPS|nr:thrombospondin type-1 domain-containing protein 4 isoform X2 [Drosophila pseudoobscura]
MLHKNSIFRRTVVKENENLRICIIGAYIAGTDCIETKISTIERIKKHQDWLKKHCKPKSYKIPTNQPLLSERSNLWRQKKEMTITQKGGKKQKQQYIQNEIIPKHSSTTNLMTLKPLEILQNESHYEISSSKLVDTTTMSSFPDVHLIKEGIKVSTESTAKIISPPMTPVNFPNILARKRFELKVRTYPRWDNWSNWSECSRSCGGGVMHQTRKCIGRKSLTGNQFISDACFGYFKRYQLCNDLPCPAKSKDFRSNQCAAYNGIMFEGHKYSWQPYIKSDAECELNCKPLGMKYYATLNESVINGTPCKRPAEYYRLNFLGRAICVDGICKAVNASGSINGAYAHSGSVSCGGLLCRPVTGIFTRDPQPDDGLVHVATIPTGASNISITELRNSLNLLVLRTSQQKSIVNSESNVSESGSYEAVGATFDYHRIDGVQNSEGVTEWITSTGPIRDSLDLLVFGKNRNPGIKYEYMLPIISDSEENELSVENMNSFLRAGGEDASVLSSSRPGRRRNFTWKVVGFRACTKSCGGGVQAPIVRCIRENLLRYYSQRRCIHSVKPVLNENLLHCNTQPCPAYWHFEKWGECHCLHEGAFRRREVSCLQELASGTVIHVDSTACMEEMPPTQKQCECPNNRSRDSSRYRLHTHSGSANSTRRQRIMVDNSSTNAVWLTSEWNQYCSATCGLGVEYRTIFCDRSEVGAVRCDHNKTPENRRPCVRPSCEDGEWFVGPWSSCNGDCFNLGRTRVVLCIQNKLIVDHKKCKSELQPQSFEKCSHDEGEITYCAPRWHYSEWSQCTKSCDGGTQRRSVRCLEYNATLNSLQDSTRCRYAAREPIFRSCNTNDCDEHHQNYSSSTCTDKLPNCKWAAQGKLCSYDYYRTSCCISCSGRV